MSIADYIVKVLTENDRPMRPSEIVAAITEGGLRTSAENGHMNAVLSALCRRTDLFERIQRGLYRLKVAQIESDKPLKGRRRLTTA